MHAVAALRAVDAPEVVLQAVASEEDGGLGTFAALERDAAFDAALLPEPTALRVVCAQAGALTFRGVVRGRAAHAAERLEGVSAIDRYVRVHAALQAHEATVNAAVTHPLMRELELPVPAAGRPGRRRRVVEHGAGPARVRGPPGRAGRCRPRRGARARCRRSSTARSTTASRRASWCGRAERSRRGRPRWITRGWASVRGALRDEIGQAEVAGVPWGADMRLFTARGIPAVMVGTRGIELAHAVDESVSLAELVTRGSGDRPRRAALPR